MNAYLYPGLRKDTQVRMLQACKFTATPKLIVQKAADAMGITPAQIYSHKRTRHLAQARRCACYIMRHLSKYPLKKIAAIFGQDHSTVLYACNQCLTQMQLYQTDRQLMQQILNSISPIYLQREEIIYNSLIDKKRVLPKSLERIDTWDGGGVERAA